VFINPKILKLNGEPWAYSEGCLSIPKIHEEVLRNEEVAIAYEDENFQHHTQTFNGISARIILHEYDHIEGKLFIDYLKPLKRKLLRSKLDDISKGRVKVDYRMEFVR
jgi:peptide deformylase